MAIVWMEIALLCAGGMARGADSVVIRDVAVFDGTRMLSRTSVAIGSGTIQAVGRKLRVAAGARVVDGRGTTLLPGLIDAHVHVRTTADLDSALTFGVTTSLDMFTRPGMAAGRSDMLSAGTPATAPGGHGTEYGLAIPTLSKPEQAEAFVAARLAEGSDYLKIMKDDGSAFGFHRPTLDAATMGALIRAAHARGRLALVHIATAQDARDAIAAGADGIAHVYPGAPDRDIVRAAAARGVFWTPTLAVIAHGAPPEARAAAIAIVRGLHEGGVRILAGTDAPNPGTSYGETLHAEMELLVEAGLSPVEALAAATSGAASAFRLADRGRIAPGLRADLVLMEGDPSRDIRATRRIVMVWKAGVVNEHGTK